MEKREIPQVQRALVLQGGGALGAYEVGVLKGLYEKIAKGSSTGDTKNVPFFDIIAGTSIGAINAAVLVGNVVNRKKTWEEALEMLERFWTDEKNGLSSTPDFSKWWWTPQYPNFPKINASEEALVKYYSVKEYIKHGIPNVCHPQTPKYDFKFGDPDNTWFVNSVKPLQDTIERYSKAEGSEKLAISTSWDKREPRLLAISVDIAEGKTVVFDSYHKESKETNDSVYMGEGITIDHIMASATIPLFYEFRNIGGRRFCDGGILSNTPFRELLQAHRDYWTKAIGEGRNEIPDLEVYIINLRPSKISTDKIPDDYDGAKERINDLIYSDRNSHYDEIIADLVTDYIELIDALKEIAKSHFKNKDERSSFENEFERFLYTKAKSGTAIRENRKYLDILKGRFKLIKVVRFEPKSYENSISGKGADFTSKTIRELIEKGKEEALDL
jgi:NTE family protein